MNNKKWYDYLWIWSIAFLVLGFFNIMFAWLGLIDFMVPLIMAIFGKDKTFCNKYCGRGQLLMVLGKNLKLSRDKKTPKWIGTKAFRYGFLAFFMIMFINMLYVTYLVFAGAKAGGSAITVFWAFKLPFFWAMPEGVTPWVTQFALGFYSVMLTSTLLGLITMFLYKPRSWCVYCPMGTMTQSICKIKHRNEI